MQLLIWIRAARSSSGTGITYQGFAHSMCVRCKPDITIAHPVGSRQRFVRCALPTLAICRTEPGSHADIAHQRIKSTKGHVKRAVAGSRAARSGAAQTQG